MAQGTMVAKRASFVGNAPHKEQGRISTTWDSLFIHTEASYGPVSNKEALHQVEQAKNGLIKGLTAHWSRREQVLLERGHTTNKA